MAGRIPFGPGAVLAVLVAASFLLPDRVVLAAPRSRAAEKVEKLYIKSLDDYDQLRLEEARAALTEAVKVARSARLTDPVVAKVYLQLGILDFVEGDPASAEERFMAALRLDGDIVLDPLVSSPSLQKAFDQARARVQQTAGRRRDGGSGGGGQGEGEGGEGTGASIYHQPVDHATMGSDVALYAEVPSGLPVARVLARFRSEGAEPYETAELSQRGKVGYAGFIPGNRIRGTRLQYYIDAIDARGNVLASAGSPDRPFVVALLEGAAGAGGGEPASTSEDEEDPFAPREGASSSRVVQFGLSLGTGVGIAKGPPIRQKGKVDVVPGLAWSSIGHVKAEGGVFATDRLLLGVEGRFQFIRDAEKGIVFEPIVAAKGRYYLGESRTMPTFLGVGGGIGSVQHLVNLGPVGEDGEDFIDTTVAGGDVAGAFQGYHGLLEVGSEVALGGFLAAHAVVQVFALFPKTSIQTDVDLGLSLAF